MSDLIRRQDAISRMSDLLMMELQGQRLPTWNEVYRAMNDVPSAEPEPKWIPVSERFPENESIVVCTVKGYESERLVITDCRYKDGIWEYLDEPSYDYWILLEGVLAWMPLPEPWRGE